MGTDELTGKKALVTGSSSGIGVDLARDLARRGCDVILLARREERLQEVASELAEEFGVDTDYVTADLSQDDAVEESHRQLTEAGHQIDILVNNAGFGNFGEFLENDWEREEALMKVDMLAPAEMSWRFGRDMIERGWGRILQTASIGSFQPAPTYTTYTAAKAFLLFFNEGLDFELADTGVSSTALCPGPTKTEFFDVSGQDLTTYQRIAMMDSDTVARKGIDGMLAGKRIVVPGAINKLTVFSSRLLPRRMLAWLGHETMKPS